MIVTKRLRLKWFLRIDGKDITFFALYSTIICIAYYWFPAERLTVPVVAIGTFGTAVAVLLGFRNNSAYERYWEARSAWGDLTNASRNFASQVIGYIAPLKDAVVNPADASATHQEVLYRHLAFINALRLQLRDQAQWSALEPFLSAAETVSLKEARNKATQLNHHQSRRLRELHADGWIESQAYVFGLMESIKEFFRCQGRAERIKQTPLPRQYGFFTKIFVWTFVLMLPFGIIQHLGWVTIPMYVVLATIFTIIEKMASRTEDPFEGKLEDVPLDAICRNIEIDVRQQLGESDIPLALEPQDGVLM